MYKLVALRSNLSCTLPLQLIPTLPCNKRKSPKFQGNAVLLLSQGEHKCSLSFLLLHTPLYFAVGLFTQVLKINNFSQFWKHFKTSLCTVPDKLLEVLVAVDADLHHHNTIDRSDSNDKTNNTTNRWKDIPSQCMIHCMGLILLTSLLMAIIPMTPMMTISASTTAATTKR